MASVPLIDLTAIDIAIWRDQRLREVSAASVNRELNIISSVFSVARTEWRWISQNPVSEIRRPPNPKSRDRRISETECVDMLWITSRMLDVTHSMPTLIHPLPTLRRQTVYQCKTPAAQQ